LPNIAFNPDSLRLPVNLDVRLNRSSVICKQKNEDITWERGEHLNAQAVSFQAMLAVGKIVGSLSQLRPVIARIVMRW
jgi:hypothetical protein